MFVYHLPPTSGFGQKFFLGQSGVGFFFVLSGFILTYAYHRQFASTFSAKAARAFHLARIARIYPVHLVTMGLCLAWFARFGAPQWNASDVPTRIIGTIAQALLLQSWSTNANILGALNTVSWSISVEAFFYVVFPVLLYGALRASRASAWVPLVAVIVLCTTELAVLPLIQPTARALWLINYYPPVRLVEFAVGMLVGIAFVRSRPRLAKGATVAEVLSIAAVAGGIAVLPVLPQTMRYAAALLPLWAMLIWTFAHGSGAISRLLSQRWCVRLGEISFAFYMVHYVVLHAEFRLLGWANAPLTAAIALGVSLALSSALFHWVEAPMRERVRQFASRRRAPRVLAPEAAS